MCVCGGGGVSGDGGVRVCEGGVRGRLDEQS